MDEITNAELANMLGRYWCPRCEDDMKMKFAVSHERICAWRADMKARGLWREPSDL